jgi:pimeloyl-ACP methyl ester carboxylesterase
VSETIFMIHGMWGGPWQWENYNGVFEAAGYRAVAPMLRFHALSPQEAPDPSLGAIGLLDYADDLEREILQLREKPIVMGHSMGGLLAQILASRGLAKALILLSPAAPAGIPAVTLSVLKSFLSNLARWGFWRKPMRPTFEEASYSVLHLLPPAEQRAAYDRFVFESGRAASEIGFWLLDPNRASRVDETKVTCPVLVVAGAKDRITPPSIVRRIARKYRADYREFANNGHWILAEPGWREIAEYTAGWLKKRP